MKNSGPAATPLQPDHYGFKKAAAGFQEVYVAGGPMEGEEDFRFRRARDEYVPPGPVETAYQTGRVVAERIDAAVRSDSVRRVSEGLAAAARGVQVVAGTAQAYGVVTGVVSGNPVAIGQAVVATARAIRRRGGVGKMYREALGKVKGVVEHREVREHRQLNRLLGLTLEEIRARRNGPVEVNAPDPLKEEEGEWEVWDIEEEDDTEGEEKKSKKQEEEERGL
jgi:hypothetical protein